MSADAISAAAGAILSLLFTYVPVLKNAFDRLSTNGQRLAMVGLLLLASIVLTLWTCSDPKSGGMAVCLGSSWRAAAQSFLFAAMANQSTHRLSPKADE